MLGKGFFGGTWVPRSIGWAPLLWHFENSQIPSIDTFYVLQTEKSLIRLRKLAKIMSGTEILFDSFSHILLKSQGNLGKGEGHCNACADVNQL